jgi:hypothetical protein
MELQLYIRPTPAELLDAFPEAKQIIPALLNDFHQRHAVLMSAINDELDKIESESPDEAFQYFWGKWLSLTLVAELLIIESSVARLHRQMRVIENKPNRESAITDSMIQAAREVPIENLLNQQFRKVGRTLAGLCPFHDERTGSFHIYPNENRGWCFGCSKGGDSINIAMLIHCYDFKEAVKFLAGNQR